MSWKKWKMIVFWSEYWQNNAETVQRTSHVAIRRANKKHQTTLNQTSTYQNNYGQPPYLCRPVVPRRLPWTGRRQAILHNAIVSNLEMSCVWLVLPDCRSFYRLICRNSFTILSQSFQNLFTQSHATTRLHWLLLSTRVLPNHHFKTKVPTTHRCIKDCSDSSTTLSREQNLR